jgi:hypothetical protein
MFEIFNPPLLLDEGNLGQQYLKYSPCLFFLKEKYREAMTEMFCPSPIREVKPEL